LSFEQQLVAQQSGAMGHIEACSELQQFIDDELLRAPLLFNQLLEALANGTLSQAPVSGYSPLQRARAVDAVSCALRYREALAETFVDSLRAQVAATHAGQVGARERRRLQFAALSLVEEDAVATDVALAHAIETVQVVAEHELRELQTFTAALVGDMDVARDANPFQAAVYARAVWAVAATLPLPKSNQVEFLRQAAEPLAQLLRRSYAAACSRLEARGVKPAAHRTLVLPGGARQSRQLNITFSPDLHSVRNAMPAQRQPLQQPFSRPFASVPGSGAAPLPTPVAELDIDLGLFVHPPADSAASDAAADGNPRHPRHPSNHALIAKSVSLIEHLFEAMTLDRRLPADVLALLRQLQRPALRLAALDPGLMERDKHPLWRLINCLAFAAELSPPANDPERSRLMRVAAILIRRLEQTAEQNASLYAAALTRLQDYLQRRLQQRLVKVQAQASTLQTLEVRLSAGADPGDTLLGTLGVTELDTVPGALLDAAEDRAPSTAQATHWLQALQLGHWSRIFIAGQWHHAQVLWLGEDRQVVLFGDTVSGQTWAIRRRALVMLYQAELLRSLLPRSIVGSAAARVHEQLRSQAA